MPTFQTFEDILAWQKARELCKKVRQLTQKPEFSKDYKLKDQILSSSGSVMDKIAEGFERQGNKEFIQFLFISKGSAGEVRSQLYRAYDFGYITQEEHKEVYYLAVEIGKMLFGLTDSIKESGLKGSKYK